MDEAMLKKMVLRAIEGGAVGTVTEIRNVTAGASHTPADDILHVLEDLEDDGLVILSGSTWRSSKGVGLHGLGDSAGTQMRSLVYLPGLVPSSYLHLSYRTGSRSFRLRNYSSDRRYLVDVPEAENDIENLRRVFPFEDEKVWSDDEAHSIDDFAYWSEETRKANKSKGLPGTSADGSHP